MVITYIFIYNVVYIKSAFTKFKQCAQDAKLILIGSPYCLKELNSTNRYNFDQIHQISRDFHQVDYKEIEEIVLEYIKKDGAQNIRLLTNEDSTHTVCAELRKRHNIPGHHLDVILPFVNKIVSKTKLGNVVRLPKFVQFDKSQYKRNKIEYLETLVQQLGFPMFAKPIDLVSSIETHYIPDLHTLTDIAERILAHGYEFEIDEFIEGDLFHCDAMIINGQVKFFMVGKCSFALARFFEGKPVGSIPIIDKNIFNELEQFCNKVFKQLECPNGAYHMEAFLDKKSQEFIFLEIAARTGGALITKVYQRLFDINIEETNYLIQAGFMTDLKVIKRDIFAGFLIFPIIEGKLINIKKPVIDIDCAFTEFVEPGDVLEQAQNLLDMSCSIIFWDKSYQKIEDAFEFLKNYRPLKMEINN